MASYWGNHTANVSLALIHGEGSEEFIQTCKDEFWIGQKLMQRVRDPEVSRRNLEALRNGSLNFEITKG